MKKINSYFANCVCCGKPLNYVKGQAICFNESHYGSHTGKSFTLNLNSEYFVFCSGKKSINIYIEKKFKDFDVYVQDIKNIKISKEYIENLLILA